MSDNPTILDCVAFANSATDVGLVREFYNPCRAVRVNLASRPSLLDEAAGLPLWLDAGIDGFSQNTPSELAKYYLKVAKDPKERKVEWREFYQKYPKAHQFGSPDFQRKPDRNIVVACLGEILDECMKLNPIWLSVPQLPFANDSSRNKLNLEMAKATAEWKADRNVDVELVLPAIFSHQNQTRGKTQWGEKAKQIMRCTKQAAASVVWVADTTIADASGKPSNQKKLEEQIKFYTYLRGILPGQKLVGGPFWGLNLVLWARALVDYPAIGVGGGYSYSVSGGIVKTGNTRLILEPLFRQCVASSELLQWLTESVAKLGAEMEGSLEFQELIGGWAAYQTKKESKRFCAERYRRTIMRLQETPPASRALTLYQWLSGCFVTGSQLGDLPSSEKSGRMPQQIAQQLMLLCLS